MQVKSMICKLRKLFAHACVSTDDQNLDLQQAALEADVHAPVFLTGRSSIFRNARYLPILMASRGTVGLPNEQ